jgi:N-dimethylarginine dimethylaminohydrolase
MFLEILETPATGPAAPAPLPVQAPREGVDSEYGQLESVLLADPRHLDLVPCNSVSNEAIRNGLRSNPARAAHQHARLAAALRAEGIEVRLVPAEPGLPDLAFTRDTSLMTPWGLIGLRPGAAHRRLEVDAVMEAAAGAGLPVLGRIDGGRIEGGDVAMIRPGLLAIGISGHRTDDDGADALAAIYERHGWEVIRYPLDPHFLHLDTIFCMVDRDLALACTDVLEDAFLARMERAGIELLPLAYKETRRLGCNLLSLGDKRVVSSGSCPRADAALEARGYRCLALDLSEFTMCGGGVHCLTMPLRRAPG